MSVHVTGERFLDVLHRCGFHVVGSTEITVSSHMVCEGLIQFSYCYNNILHCRYVPYPCIYFAILQYYLQYFMLHRSLRHFKFVHYLFRQSPRLQYARTGNIYGSMPLNRYMQLYPYFQGLAQFSKYCSGQSASVNFCWFSFPSCTISLKYILSDIRTVTPRQNNFFNLHFW